MIKPEAIVSREKGKLRRYGLGATFLGIMAGATLAGGLAVHSMDDETQNTLIRDATNEATGFTRCEQIVKQNLKPGSRTAIVHLSQLTTEQRKDCGINALSYTSAIVPLDGKIVDQSIQLPSVERLQSAVHTDLATASDYSTLEEVGVAIIGSASGLLAGMGLTYGLADIVTKHDERRSAHIVQAPQASTI